MSRDELVADLMRRLRYRRLDAFVGRRVEVRSLETAHDDVAAALSDILSCRLAPNEVDRNAMGHDLGKFSTLELAFAIQRMGADVHVPRADAATLTALRFRFNWTDEELASTIAAEEDRTYEEAYRLVEGSYPNEVWDSYVEDRLVDLLGGLEAGQRWIRILMRTRGPQGLEEACERLGEHATREEMAAFEAVWRKHISDVTQGVYPAGFWPRDFTVVDACLTNAPSAVWSAKHFRA